MDNQQHKSKARRKKAKFLNTIAII